MRGKVLEREIQILKLVDHPHIVYLDRVYESAKRIYLIMEKCNMELAALLKEKTVFSEAEARKVLQGLSSAVAYLHKHGTVPTHSTSALTRHRTHLPLFQKSYTATSSSKTS